MILPGLGHHHHDGLGQRSSCHQEELEHVVEGSGIGAVRLANGEAFLQVSIDVALECGKLSLMVIGIL